MPAQSRTKQPIRGAKTKGNRRTPVKSTTDMPVMAIVVGVVLLVLFAGIAIYGALNNHSTTGVAKAGSIPCENGEHDQVHYHVALQIIYQGELHPIEGGIGIQGGEAAPTCFYWLHVHSANQDVIHIEAPATRVFTLGDFFKIWDVWSTAKGDSHQLLDSTHVSTLTVGPNQALVVYVDLGDGKGPTVYTGDPTKIELKSHEIITIEITPPTATPPPFTFETGL